MGSKCFGGAKLGISSRCRMGVSLTAAVVTEISTFTFMSEKHPHNYIMKHSNYVGCKIFRNNIEISTFMVKLYLFALNTQEIKIGVILVLGNTEYLPLFEVKHKFSMTLILLKRGIPVRIWIRTGPLVSGIPFTFLSVLVWSRPLLMFTVRDRRLRLWLAWWAECCILPCDSLAKKNWDSSSSESESGKACETSTQM